jgi:hypothetical protein
LPPIGARRDRPRVYRRTVTRRDASLLLLLSAIWGSSFLFISLGVDELEPSVVVLGRLLAGLAVLLPLVAGMIWMGVYPTPFLERADVTLTALIETVERKSAQTFFPLSIEDRPAAPADAAGSSVAAAGAGAAQPRE